MQYVLILFAVLSIVGSYAAWRRSPLYSLKTTLRLIGIFVGIVAVTLGSVWAIVSGPLARSPLAQGLSLFLAILLLSTSAMVAIVRITDRHVAQLPANVRLVTLNRHKVTVWIWRFLVYLIAMAAASAAVPESWFWLPSMLGGFPLLILAPMLAIFYMMARRNDLGMTAVMADPWAHWQYSPEDWQAWAQNQLQWEKSKQTPFNWKWMTLFVLFCTSLLALGALFSGGSLHENMLIVCGGTGLVVLMIAIALLYGKISPGRRYRRLLAALPEAWFGDEGLFCNGVYWPWTLSGKYLVEADTIRDAKNPPALLLFVFQSFNGSSSVRVVQRVPIPDGQSADLVLIQRKLSAVCSTAIVRLC